MKIDSPMNLRQDCCKCDTPRAELKDVSNDISKRAANLEVRFREVSRKFQSLPHTKDSQSSRSSIAS